MTPLYVLLGALTVMLASFSGAVFITKNAGSALQRHMPYFVAFSAGLFSVVVYHLFVESFELLPINQAVGYISAGFLGFLAFAFFVPEGDHHPDPDCDHVHPSKMAWRVVIGDALHNIGDGIVLLPAFLVDVRLGLGAAVGIFLHEFIQELSEYIIMREAGWSVKKTLITNFLVSSTIFIGIALSSLLVQSEQFLGPIFAVSAGAFFFIVVYDLFPRLFFTVRHHRSGYAFLWFIAGIATLLAISSILPHE